jgi:hypothetical protein
LAGGIAELDLDADLSFGGAREDTDIGEPEGISGKQFESAGHAVPIALGVVGDAVGVGSDGDEFAIVDPQRQLMASRCDGGPEVIGVRRAEGVLRTDLLIVQPQRCAPMRAFELDHEPAAEPGLGNVDVALVPGDADVTFLGLKPERDFDIAGLAVGGVAIGGEPGAFVEGTGPEGVRGDVIAVTALLK